MSVNRVLRWAACGFVAVFAAQVGSTGIGSEGAVIAALVQDPAEVEAPGGEVTEKVCNSCHGPENYNSYQNTRREWKVVVEDMVGRGATGTDEEFAQVISYLTAEYGKPLKINEAPARDIQVAMDLTPDQAQAIIDYRTKNGPFKTIDDVLKVTGVPTDRVQEQRKNLVFAPPAS